ncbi:MAG TPA: hypothetical protein VFY89_01185 [Ktedonobacterales bacterium]
MIDSPSGDNWLDARSLACPHCQTALYAVIRSPLYDEWQLYCDRCANRVEIRYDDPIAQRLGDELSARSGASAHRTIAHLRAIETRLKPCSCGGRYHHDSPRRCHACHGVVLAEASDTDLWHAVYGIDADERDLTAEEAATAAHFEATHIRRADIWL